MPTPRGDAPPVRRTASLCGGISAACLAVALLLAGCAVSTVPAGWQWLAPGLLYRQQAPGLHLLQFDLREPALRLALTPPAQRGLAPEAMPAAAGARVVVNASFFDIDFRVRGLTVSDGQAWPEPMAPQASPLLACDRAQRCKMQMAPPHVLPAGTWTAVAGTPWLVRDGRARTVDDDARCPGFCGSPHPRTAIGLDATRRTLIVVLAEGRREGVPGLTLAELAQVLQAQGAAEAINLDGGGSSALWIDGRAVMQRPANEPASRPVANALVVRNAP
jgi:exopolysaccharide biosynthesis protein